jgi:hypothetical protein
MSSLSFTKTLFRVRKRRTLAVQVEVSASRRASFAAERFEQASEGGVQPSGTVLRGRRSACTSDGAGSGGAPNGADQALSVRILPGCPRSGEHLGDAEPEHAVATGGTIDSIAIPKQVAGCRFLRERLHNLANRPLCSGMVCDVEVEHSPWIRGAPQSEFVVVIRRRSLKSSGSTRGLPGRR